MDRRQPFFLCAIALFAAFAARADQGGASLHSASKGLDFASSISAAMARAREMVGGMSVEERAGQLILVGVGGRGVAPPSTLAMIRNLGPGGILLFGFNVPENPTRLCPALESFQAAARASAAGLALFVAIDHEGGSVFRFKGGITRPPPPLETARRGPAFAALLGEREALELGDLGINMVLGPVVEALTAENQAFLGDRSFGREPSSVDAVAAAYIGGLARGGAIAVAKHFPADGPADPHRSLPRLEVSAERLKSLYLARFASAVKAGVPVVMISHILVEAVDPGQPATLSHKVIGVLRKELGFEGVVLTDDLLMKALGMPVRVSAPRAIAAGADLLMLSSEEAAIPARDAIVSALRSGILTESRLDEAAARVVALKLASPGLEGGMVAKAWALAGSRAPGPRCASFAARVAESAHLLEGPSALPR